MYHIQDVDGDVLQYHDYKMNEISKTGSTYILYRGYILLSHDHAMNGISKTGSAFVFQKRLRLRTTTVGWPDI